MLYFGSRQLSPKLNPTMASRLFLTALLALFVSPAFVLADEELSQKQRNFEETIRPLLAEHCFECHSSKKQQGDVRLDRRKFVFADGSTGKLVVPGNLVASRLWQVVKYDDFDTQMPPKGKLSAEKLQTIRHWIEAGAFWPEETALEEESGDHGIPLNDDGTIDFTKVRENHWAYQPVPEPDVKSNDELSPIDQILRKKLNEKNLDFSPPSDRQTLIRRLSFDLRGLPPTIDEVREFQNDESPRAFEKLVDRYLSDSAYGQRWGRYWLDIARYADTKGYVFTQNRFYPYSYTYRDYVIDAFNNDKPYDTFLMEQLAADHLGYNENDPRLAALGFLTIGPRFLNREPDIIDDRIDVVTRGLMGMTVGCARCHDHKFDPIPTADYYSLYGVFNSSYEPDLPPLRGELDTSAEGYDEFAAELSKREKAASDYLINTHNELIAKARNELEDYFPAAMKALNFLPKDHELTTKHGTPRARLVALWQQTIQKRLKNADPAFIPGAKFTEAIRDGIDEEATENVLVELEQNDSIPEVLIERFRVERPQTNLDIVNLYVDVLAQIRDEWEEFKKQNPEATQFEDSGKEKIRRVLYGPDSLSDVDPGDYSPLFERDNRDKYRALQKKIDEWHVESPNAPPRSMVLLDKEKLVEPVVFVRGNQGRRGDRVPRRAPQILDESPDNIFKESSGRRELAEMIVDKSNPLTARVFVNRVWKYHFGTPLVATPSDFGLQISEPVQRELLDYLAWSFMHNHNWSIKGLHREILASQAWQQQSVDRPEARKVDPENQLYWKQNRKRLDFEAMRDSMLAVAGRLDASLGGRPVDIEKSPFPNRRTVYALIDRNNPSGLLRTFDFPTPNSSSPARSETTVPQQALFSMNSKFAKEMAAALADRVRNATSDGQYAGRLIEMVYSRRATLSEIELLNRYLEDHSLDQLAQGLLFSNEFFFVD